jgi:hypothetical protein
VDSWALIDPKLTKKYSSRPGGGILVVQTINLRNQSHAMQQKKLAFGPWYFLMADMGASGFACMGMLLWKVWFLEDLLLGMLTPHQYKDSTVRIACIESTVTKTARNHVEQ